MPVPFEASRLKIWRAEQHTVSLETEIRAYMDRAPAHANIRPGTPVKDAGMIYHETILTEPIPIHISTVLGDVIHNLRTSLDLLASELVRMNGGTDDDVYFPFAKDAAQLEDMIKRRHIDRAAPDVIDLVRHFKPYIGGNTDLRGIHDLDIIDKHQTLITAHGNIRVPVAHTDEKTFPSSGVGFDRFDKSGVERQGKLTSGYTRADNWPIGEGLPVRFSITFPQGGPFAAQDVTTTCQRLVKEFTGVVDAFELLSSGTVTKEFPWSSTLNKKGAE